MMGKEHPTPEPSHRPPSKFLTVQGVAEFLRLSVRTVYDMVSQKRIPYRKAGDRTIFALDEILEWTKPDEER